MAELGLDGTQPRPTPKPVASSTSLAGGGWVLLMHRPVPEEEIGAQGEEAELAGLPQTVWSSPQYQPVIIT